MGKMYVARCKGCGKVVFASIANTPMEQADCAGDIKKLTKQGHEVELIEVVSGDPMPEWCFNGRRCKG